MPMDALISLMGEQPMPALLPARFLKAPRNILVTSDEFRRRVEYVSRLIDGAEIVEVEPYDLEGAYRKIRDVLEGSREPAINMTGGTKIMALAAFHAAGDRKCRLVYMTTAGGACTLSSYYIGRKIIRLESSEPLPELITIDDYLRAHLPGYSIRRPETREDGTLLPGHKFEKEIARILKSSGFEVLIGVEPEGMEKQEEIDLVVRRGNVVGVVEVKVHRHDKYGKPKIHPEEAWHPKRGYEQLLALCAREYLGLETKRIFITDYKNEPEVRTFGDGHGIRTIELCSCFGGSFPPGDKSDEYKLVREMKTALT
ncbi:MAG: YraN family protein [Bacteroidota bacterium]|nr:YraN family protein [Bacteroidota bacterium]